MWASVRDAVSVLLGGNLGEIAFTLGSGLVSRTGSVLNARQLLLVNLLTDLLPALALAVRPPVAGPGGAARRGPGPVAGRGADPRRGGAGGRDRGVGRRGLDGWPAAPAPGRHAEHRRAGRRSSAPSWARPSSPAGAARLVLAASAVSAGGLVAVVQTPGLSHFFGCRPLGPVGWSIALTAAGLGTGAAAVLPRLVPAPTPHPTTRPTEAGRERSRHEPHDAEENDGDRASPSFRNDLAPAGFAPHGGA